VSFLFFFFFIISFEQLNPKWRENVLIQEKKIVIVERRRGTQRTLAVNIPLTSICG